MEDFLYKELIKNLNDDKKLKDLNISGEENIISTKVLETLKPFPLIDFYKVYQTLNDEWKSIIVDLETIKIEGFDCTKQVDPNIVIKKKSNIETEEQDGYKGHIIPFEIAQKHLEELKLKKNKILEKEQELEAIAQKYIEIYESISEDDKETEKILFNDEKETFVNSEVTKYVKTLKGKKFDDPECFESKIKEVSNLLTRESALKKEIIIKEIELEDSTKKAIEELTDDQIKAFLKEKWIDTLINSFNTIPNILLNEFASNLTKLSNKYKQTLLELETEIKKSEKELSILIDELDANEFDKKGLSELKKLLGGE
ncbi:hypothetical protein [Metamycoplasma hyosynoviae]|uniref:hypothetical protein n=1 Tax=Metamycoplasma hyosynoviae TaxID=29559 RepID=UPI002359B9B3|nr:hypothetical protein [Metamycoplasma hyosynoviae]MDC8914707.1 hypothetical protein [Metamycoplasma hyosynoviae]